MTVASLSAEERTRATEDRNADLLELPSYFASDIFDREAERIFARQWHFIGTTHELSQHNDFVTLDLPLRSVVVQNFRGELRAFENICTHRLNRIQVEARGRRPLLCGYHNWNFDRDGFPFGRPNRDQFPAETSAQRARLCLPAFRVATCGIFVFLDLGGAEVTLPAFLGGNAALLEEISGSIGSEIGFGEIDHAANWKLLVENVLECYHCQAVHPETFIAGLGVGKKPIEGLIVESGHSSCHFPRTPGRREDLRSRMLAHLDQRTFRHESFFHLYVFPNLFISSQEGLTFYIGQAIGRAADRTILRTRMFEPQIELAAKARARQDLMNEQSVKISSRVIEEDRAILENIQRSIKVASSPGVLGGMERRISAFHRRYEEAMSV